jgi:tetratricopeptide (TPR) repeat protein
VRINERTLYILGAIALLAILFFGFDHKPSSQKALEKSRAMNTRKFDISAIEKEGTAALTPDQREYLEMLTTQLQHVTADSQKIRLLQEISGFWYQMQSPILAGLFAKEAAQKENTPAAWSITGTTFAASFSHKDWDEDRLNFAREEAVDAFEKAISLDPENIAHRLNQALCYVEVPQQDMPMKGIQMLSGLTSTFPGESLPYFHLARLAVQTGQHERAAQRIEQAIALEPENGRFACLAVEIYQTLGEAAKAEKWQDVCAKSTNSN